VIGNIPYNITTPILFHIVDARSVIKDFMVMMQTEVAQRLVAQPRTKEYGILSVFLQYYCTSKILFSVSKNSFFPVPSVSSTVVHLDFSKPGSSRATDDRLFRRIVRGTFGTRRKTLRNGLRNIGVPVKEFDRLSVDLELRPEELTVHDFVKLSNELIHLAGTIVIPGTEEPHG
jgi:16S rRNA (adenine1518-N6/adenine1519-N6)-dimethyltransferase